MKISLAAPSASLAVNTPAVAEEAASAESSAPILVVGQRDAPIKI